MRRRLFEPITEQSKFVARDAVARAFVDMYGAQHNEFPNECREGEYERRIKQSYPIHPELFDRLYNDWSTLDRFQRTRGVLRLMATVIHALWERQDANLLIMPATVPIDQPSVQSELTRYLDDQWAPVIAKDVDGEHSLPLAMDRENPNLGRYSACRRVARTIYMGSAPIQKAANRGIDDRHVKLGCVQPGETVATFGDALRRLTDKATYLFEDGKRYWYSTQPTVSRLAEDRANQLHEQDVNDEIMRRLREEAKSRGDFARVHVGVSNSDIPDECECRLVILGPEFSHTRNDRSSTALQQAQSILEHRGNSPRNYKNTLIFLAADAQRLKELQEAVKQYLAWKTIYAEKETLNLDAFQSKQAETRCKGANDTINARVPETYQWLLVPAQPDPKGPVEWNENRQQGTDSLALRAGKKAKNEEFLFTQMGSIRLRHELDKIPLWRGNHVPIKQLMNDFATYLYLPRLRDSDVLVAAIHEGLAKLTWQSETFAYAEQYDEKTNRYLGLTAGKPVQLLTDSQALLVKPDIAASQIEADRKNSEPQPAPATSTTAVTGQPKPDGASVPGQPATTSEPTKTVYRRFHGAVRLDPIRVGRDASRIADEVIQHLSGIVGANVEVTLEIQAILPDGAPDKTVRDITENCRVLKFQTFGFEEQ